MNSHFILAEVMFNSLLQTAIHSLQNNHITQQKGVVKWTYLLSFEMRHNNRSDCSIVILLFHGLVHAVWPWVAYLGLTHGTLWSNLFVLNILWNLVFAMTTTCQTWATTSMSIANQMKQLYECRDVTTKIPSPHADITKIVEVEWEISREGGHIVNRIHV